jgi:hypothetical protein
MLKRVLLSLTFVVVLAAAGLGMSRNAAAYGCDYGYGGYGGYGSYYPDYSYGYGPRVSYYRGSRYGHRSFRWDDHHHGHRHHRHHHHDHGGLHFSFGF